MAQEHLGKRPIKYIGTKAAKYAYGPDGTLYTWTPGSTVWVPEALATILLSHSDAFAENLDSIPRGAQGLPVKAVGYVRFTGRPTDDQLLTINGRKYEYDDDASGLTAGSDVLWTAGADLDGDEEALAAAINNDASASVSAVADTTNDFVWLYAKVAGTTGNAITLASTLSNATISAATLANGLDADDVDSVVNIRHTITTDEATGGKLRFDTGLSSITGVIVGFEDNGVIAAAAVTYTATNGILVVTEGTTAWAANDVLNIVVIGKE